MVNNKQAAIIKKELKGIVFDKYQFPVLLIVPFVFTVVLPTLFVMMAHFGTGNLEDLQKLLDLFPLGELASEDPMFLINAILNYVMPVLFMIIPIMAAMIMAASSFVGEKENRTLETLLYSPLSLRQIFQAKTLAAFILSMLVSLGSFFVMLVAVEAETLLLLGSAYIPSVNWLINLLLVSPAISLISITLIVRGSAKAKTMQESQQKAVLLILPIVLLVTGQFMGVVLIGPLVLLCLGIACALLAFYLLKGAIGRFTYETVLE